MSVCLSPPTLLVPQSHAFQQSYLSAIMPVGHHAHHTSEFQDLKTALLAFQYYSQLLSLSACFVIEKESKVFQRLLDLNLKTVYNCQEETIKRIVKAAPTAVTLVSAFLERGRMSS